MLGQTGGMEGDEMQGKYLSFDVADENFAVDILGVREIIEYSEAVVTSVPLVPDVILGVMNLRGKAVPVIDLGARLTNQKADISRRSCIVVIEIVSESCRMEVGVLVDAVSEVMEINKDQIEAAPSFGEGINTDFIAGMGKVGERFVMMLNVDRVVSMQDLQQIVEMGA